MANNVVIGDLGKLRKPDALRFEGAEKCTFPSVSYVNGDSLTLSFTSVRTIGGDDYILGYQENFSQWAGFLSNDNLAIRWSDGTYFTAPSGITSNGYYDIMISITSGNLVSAYVDGELVGTGDSTGKTLSIDSLAYGRRLYYSGVIRDVVLVKNSVEVGRYIQNGDFGNTTLIDQSGSGNDGTIIGATWWRQGVDEVYSDPTLYRSTLPIPLNDDQYVTYTDGTPFYPAGDDFWIPYNSDPTYDFTVVKQSSISIGQGLYQYGSSMKLSFSL